MGIFGGSGVGKSTLLGAMSRHNSADVTVIALIGERNREVRAFLEHELGPEGSSRSVVVCATSDRPAPLRVRACFVALAIAEYFRDQGANVLLIMDSVTRLAMAQREIGLAAGEPPSQKGYTPSVFNLLPKILERAGNFQKGSITGFFTVLVEGDDFNEPICDAVRAILDGHIILSRRLAAIGHYPAIDVMHSISRLTSQLSTPEQLAAARKIREAISTYEDSKDLIELGAYTPGSNPRSTRRCACSPRSPRSCARTRRRTRRWRRASPKRRPSPRNCRVRHAGVPLPAGKSSRMVHPPVRTGGAPLHRLPGRSRRSAQGCIAALQAERVSVERDTISRATRFPRAMNWWR
jgi:FliI/YscN family ATPase